MAEFLNETTAEQVTRPERENPLGRGLTNRWDASRGSVFLRMLL